MKLFQNLRFRLILLVLLAVIPAILVTTVAGLDQRRLARENAEENALRLARAVANYQIMQIESGRQLIQVLKTMGIDRFVDDPAGCHQTLSTLREQYPIYSAFSLVDKDGDMVCSSTQIPYNMNIADRAYFQTAVKTRELVIGSAITTRITNNAALPFAMPLLDETGQPAAVMVAMLNLEALNDMAKTVDLPPKSAVLIIDNNGAVLMRYPSGDAWAGNTFSNTAIIQEILKKHSEGRAEATGLDGVNRFYGFAPILQTPSFRLVASVGIPTEVAFADVDQALWQNIFWISIIAVLSLVVAWFGGDVLFLRVVSLTAERDEAERNLRAANQELEVRVIERTAALDLANKQLNVELDQRQRAVEQLREREEALENMLTLVERSNSELEHFAYITSHDLQEPLRKIQAFGERLLKRYSENLGEEGANYITRMSASANRMQKMVDDLLVYSRVSSRGNEFVLVDLNEVMRDVISDLEMRIIETNAQVSADTLPVMRADASQMRQLFQNLIINALKFHRQGVAPMITIHCQVNTGSSYPPEYVFEIEDNGIGFDEKYLDRIFLPFQRLHGQDVFEGSGIGLAICRKITQRHGGSITAKSEPGKGSKFIVRIPRYAIFVEGDKP